MRVIIIGGASGVGKSSLLQQHSSIPQINTGTLFKERMKLVDRDTVRSTNWSDYEDVVAGDLAKSVVIALKAHRVALIDTHFAAKIKARSYRIGLGAPLLSRIAHEVFAFGDEAKEPIRVAVVLVRCGIHSLLRRRRLDKNRNRELLPSDCYKALLSNDRYFWDYYHGFLRASPLSDYGTKCHVVENEDFQTAQGRLSEVVQGNTSA